MRITITLTPQEEVILEKLAAQDGLSKSAVIRMLINRAHKQVYKGSEGEEGEAYVIEKP